MIPEKCQVLRDGGKTEVLDAWELVPGDVVLINDGDQVPADVRIVESSEVKVDNASLTGESEPVEKSHLPSESVVALEASNLLFYTCMVQTGNCKAIVIGTGDNTQVCIHVLMYVYIDMYVCMCVCTS